MYPINMRNYTKLEIAAILRRCENTRELMYVCRIFYYLFNNWRHPYWGIILELSRAREKTFNSK